MALEGLQTTLGGIGDDVTTFISENPITSAAIGAGAVGLGVGVVALASAGGKSKKKTSKRGRKRDRTFKSKQKHEQRYKRKRKYKKYGTKGWIQPAGKRTKRRRHHCKRHGHYHRTRGVHYTKNGQPYIILRSGKARFIKRRK